MTILTKFLCASVVVAVAALCLVLKSGSDASSDVKTTQMLHGNLEDSEGNRPAGQNDSIDAPYGSVAFQSETQIIEETASGQIAAIGPAIESSMEVPKRMRGPKKGETEGVEISVPVGVGLPIALVQSNEGVNESAALTPAQMKMVDRLAMDFAAEVAAGDVQETPDATERSGRPNQVAPRQTDDPAALRWNTARVKADQRFRSLFGDDAYNRELIRQFQQQAAH